MRQSAGQRFPTLAAARANVYVNTCKFINNVCTVPRCHTPGIYLTEGARCVFTPKHVTLIATGLQWGAYSLSV
jgi:hypothetical protein